MKVRDIIIYNCLITVVIFVPILSAQSTKYTIDGRVNDKETNYPIFNANVFFANTTIGTTTGKNGFYLIKFTNPGVYELVIQHIGYDIKTRKVHFLNSKSITINMQLNPRVYKGEEITITADIPKIWKKRFEEFKKILLGETENARKCKILNPEVMEFELDSKSKELIARSDSALIVENYAFGYIIKNYVDSCSWLDKRLFYSVFSKFEPILNETESQIKKWENNRLRSYNGSLKNFLCALFNNKTREEGFRIYYGYLPQLKSGVGYFVNQDYLTTNKAESTKTNEPRYVVLEKAHPQELHIFDNIFKIKRFYFKNWIRIDYEKYPRKMESYLSLNDNFALIDSLGNINNPIIIEIDGDWSKQRIADRLPKDYHP